MKSEKEFDPNGMTGEPGTKLDGGKPQIRYGLIECFPRACMAVAQVTEYGDTKYAKMGWLLTPDAVNRYGNAGLRHACYSAMGEKYDKDSGLLHAAHECWNAMARLEHILIEMENNKK